MPTENSTGTEGRSGPEPAHVVSGADIVTSSAAAQGFWGRIREHKVVQWTLVYAAAAYTLLHVVEMVGEAFDWPHLIARIVTLGLFLGVPVAATLAWYHGHRALHRVSGPELAILTALLFIAGSVVWFVGSRPSHEHLNPPDVGQDQRSTAQKSPVAEPPEKSIAVLPFVDLSEKQDQAYFGAGIAEEIVSVLASLPGIKVIGQTSSFQFKSRDEDVRQIGLKLAAAYVLGGSVQRSGQHVRVTARLVDARAGTQVWAANYDRNVTDVLSIQEEISAGIARALQIAVSAAGGHSLRRVDSDAYEYYLRGLYALDQATPDSLLQAKSNLEQAIALDPNFVPALEALTLTNYEMGEDEDVPPRVAWQAARAVAERVLQLDQHSATAHGVLGFVYGFDEFNWARADSEIREALAASRRSPTTDPTARLRGCFG